ncbi:protein PTST homolog 3, chloroplastic isoform X2 [Lycium barbarum]|uniref:protein PTST homolog 3, chloroplastic isoform X2 n=1 Tax=Lycium barbarum TaxID=112863 RepID=UPI00293F0CBB|nr:protein PTST homolog 3, chloroplastic isoform X2 [Lycium barbarum]
MLQNSFHFKNFFVMATLFHFPTSHKLFFSPTPSLCIHHNHHHFLLIYPSKPAICASIKKPRASRKVKSNVDLCNDIREFLSSVGLPEDHVPTMKELSQHGRQDLANIVRRRGYKLVKELLLTSKQLTYDCSGEDGLVEKSEDEPSDGKITDMAYDVSLPSEASAADDYTNDANNDIILNSDEQNSGDQEPLGYSSLEEKVANFIQNGELDGGEDSGFEIFQGGEQVEGSVEGQNVVETESTTPTEHIDLVYDGNGAEIFNGNSMAQSTQHVKYPSMQTSPMRNDSLSTEGRNSADTERELELTHLKQQIEEEKRKLSILQIKAETEIRDAQRLITEKDAELNAVEDSLSGLKEVEVQYRADGEHVEVAGSFNGWHHKVKMDLQESSDPIGKDIQASSDIIDPTGMREPRLWKTVLWLYPGIYEEKISMAKRLLSRKQRTIIASVSSLVKSKNRWRSRDQIKFIVDNHWTTDPQRESVTRGSIHNNVLRVDR